MERFCPKLLIRADAGAALGGGHVARMLALAEAWMRHGGVAEFVTHEVPPSWRPWIDREGHAVCDSPALRGSDADAEQLAERADRGQADWIVLDGDAFGPPYQQRLCERLRSLAAQGRAESAASRRPPRLLAVSDAVGPATYAADVVLHPHPFGDPEDVRGPAGMERWMGSQWALVREAFAAGAAEAARREVAARAQRLWVGFGASDPTGCTLPTLEILDGVSGRPLEIDVVLGPGLTGIDAIERCAAALRHRVQVHVDPRSPAELMRRADLAITAAGSTCYELAACGVPMIVRATVGNQRPVSAALVRLGAACLWPEGAAERAAAAIARLVDDAEQRRRMVECGRRWFDGRGARRVARAMVERLLSLRPATEGDAEQLFAWQQDRAVRAASWTDGPEDFSSHCRWLAARLASDGRSILIAETPRGDRLACLRIDRGAGSEGTVGISLDAAARGCHLASLLLEAAVRQWRSRGDLARLVAWIKPDNVASQRVFADRGFRLQALERRGAQAAQKWVLDDEARSAAERIPQPEASA